MVVGRGSSVQSLGSSTQPAPATASRLQLSQTSRSQSAAGWSETWRLHQWEASAAETAVCTAGTGPGGGAGRPFTPAGAGVGEMVQLSWRVECRVLHSGACHNTLCPSCHTRPRPPARTSCAQSPGPRLQHSVHSPQVRDGDCCCPPTAAVYQSLGRVKPARAVTLSPSRVTCHVSR